MSNETYAITEAEIAKLIFTSATADADGIAALIDSLPLITGEPVATVESNALWDLIGDYWDAAYKEGQTGIPQSTEANDILHKMRQLFEPLQPITAEMVTDEMVNAIADEGENWDISKSELEMTKAAIAATYNAVTKGLSK